MRAKPVVLVVGVVLIISFYGALQKAKEVWPQTEAWPIHASQEYGPMGFGFIDIDQPDKEFLVGQNSKLAFDNLGLEFIYNDGRVPRDLRFADLDGDGYQDAISNVYQNNPRGFIQFYWGNSNGRFILDQELSNEYYGMGETIVIADFTNDGLLDIFVAQYATPDSGEFARNLMFVQEGNRRFSEQAMERGVASSSQSKPEGAQAADFNVDGNIDLFAGGSLFLNLGSGYFKDVLKDSQLSLIRDEGLMVTDLNYDGRLDIALNSLSPEGFVPAFFVASSDRLVYKQWLLDNFPVAGIKNSFGFSVSDVNYDGKPDVIRGGGIDELTGKNLPPISIISKGNAYVTRELLPNDGSSWSDLVTFFDMDNDGFKDAVVRYGSRIHIFKNPMKRNSITKIRIQGQNSMRNQFGRTVEIESRENSKKIAFVVDGGSGFMVSSNYDIFADLSELGRFQIRVVCREKILTENFEVAPSQILLSCE